MKIQINLLVLTLVFALSASCNVQEQAMPTDFDINTVIPISTLTHVIPTPSQQISTIDPNKKFEEWLEGSSTCVFPCWAGIIPSQTGWEEAYNLLSEVVTIHSHYDLLPTLQCRYGNCKSLYWQYEINNELYSVELYEKSDLVHSISISGGETANLSMLGILEKYGEPDQVLLSASSFTLEGKPSLTLILLYEDNKFVARYLWWATFETDQIRACGTPDFVVSIGIVDIEPGNWTSFDITQGARPLKQGTTIENFRPLAEVTNVSVPFFYESAIQLRADFCISTSTSYWQ